MVWSPLTCMNPSTGTRFEEALDSTRLTWAVPPPGSVCSLTTSVWRSFL